MSDVFFESNNYLLRYIRNIPCYTKIIYEKVPNDTVLK